MKDQKKTQEKNVQNERRPFVKPELTRRSKLPEVTNSFIGSFTP